MHTRLSVCIRIIFGKLLFSLQLFVAYHTTSPQLHHSLLSTAARLKTKTKNIYVSILLGLNHFNFGLKSLFPPPPPIDFWAIPVANWNKMCLYGPCSNHSRRFHSTLKHSKFSTRHQMKHYSLKLRCKVYRVYRQYNQFQIVLLASKWRWLRWRMKSLYFSTRRKSK